MSVDFAQKVTISPDALFQEVSSETVILDINSEQYFGLDEVGTRIWQLLQENTDMLSIYAAMLEEYEVDPDTLKADIQRLLNELMNAGLISEDS